MNEEIWKPIKNFSDYEISNKGRLRSSRTGNKTKIIKGSKDLNGYIRTQIINDTNKREWKFLHRLVAKHFIPNPENKPCINHIDCDTSNNHVDNLEWCTHKENTKHAMDNGLANIDGLINNYGENHHQSKLTKEKVLEIRKRYDEENITQIDLSKQYPVSHQTINRIVNNKIWSHI